MDEREELIDRIYDAAYIDLSDSEAIADALLAAGWVKGRKEWGIACEYLTHDGWATKTAGNYTSPEAAAHIAEKLGDTGHSRNARVVRRTVTEWVEA